MPINKPNNKSHPKRQKPKKIAVFLGIWNNCYFFFVTDNKSRLQEKYRVQCKNH